MSTAKTRSRTASTRRRVAPAETALAAPFLSAVAEPVRQHLAATVTLREFVQTAGLLTLEQRRLLVDQALILMEQNYVHLPLKVALHGIDPVQRLRLLRIRLQRQTAETMEPERQFHAEMSEIFHSVRDLHTNYLLPAPFAGKVAFLPFMIEEFFDDAGDSHFVVSHIVEGFSAPAFEVGVEVTHWSGIPIARAVEGNAARFAGSNRAARHARGVESLTVRPLVIHRPPDEEWVTVHYMGADGVEHELQHDWMVTDNLPPFVGDTDAISTAAASQGVDLDSDEAGRAKALLYAPQVVDQAQGGDAPALTTDPAEAGAEVPTEMPGVFRARSVTTSSGEFGHIRIFTFSVEDPDAFVDEFVRLIGLLPQNGLIVDVRDNGGGHIFASEFTLQTLTPRRIVPEPVQFISTPLNLKVVRKHREDPTGQIDLGPWFASLDQATEIGATFSGAFPITPTDGANAIGQRYHGPVVLITDARCYSATDIFAAGFSDHAVGPILGVDDNTGAGGANVWTHGLLMTLLRTPTVEPDSPYKTLPNGANMRVSIRRTLRVGESNPGTPVEDLGVQPDHRHSMTRDDVLSDNVDLLNRAGELLAERLVRTLIIDVEQGDDGTLTLQLQTGNVDRLDVFVDGRPRASADVTDGSSTITVANVPDALAVRIEGFAAGELVASRTLTVGADSATATATASARVSRVPAAAGAGPATVLYVHGAGNKPSAGLLKRSWDTDLFGRDMGARTRMVHYADLLHARPGVIGADACSQDEALAALVGEMAASENGADTGDITGLGDLTPEGQELALNLSISMAAQMAGRADIAADGLSGVLPLPAALRRLLLRQLLTRLIPDADAYFFTGQREPIRQRLRDALDAVDGPAVVVAHSLGTVIAYDVLSEPRYAAEPVPLLVTMGAPLGYTEIQDVVTKPLAVPTPVRLWMNFADRADVVTLDTGLANDFAGGRRLLDTRVNNLSPNNHASCGYLRTSQVRASVHALVPASA